MAFFYLYLFASLVLGTFTVGPFSIRVYFTVVMAAYLLLVGRKERHADNRISYQILLFVALYLSLTALSLTMCGELNTSDFPKSLLSLFFNCFITFFAFNHFVQNSIQLKHTIIFLIIVLVVNCIITILQYQGNPIGIGIALGLINDPERQVEILSGENIFGKDITIGIFNYVFINGNYIAIVGLMLLGVWESSKNALAKIVCLSLFVLFVVASFVTQSRTPFILLLLFSFYIAMRGFLKKKAGFIVAACFLLLLVLIIPLLLDTLDFGRLFNSDNYENDPRQKIWESCFEFISGHLMWGGPVLFEKTYNIAPHNYFLGAFISSGLLGGLVASFIYFRVLFQSITLFIGKHSMLVSSLAGAVLIYSIGSLFHNASIISGDTMFFVIYCLMLKSQLLEKEYKLNTSSYV